MEFSSPPKLSALSQDGNILYFSTGALYSLDTTSGTLKQLFPIGWETGGIVIVGKLEYYLLVKYLTMF